MKVCSVFLLAILAYTVSAEFEELSKHEIMAHQTFKKLLDNVQLTMNVNNTLFYESLREYEMKHGKQTGTLQHFHYENCADSGKEQVVTSNVYLKPDPLVLPGKVTTGGNLEVKEGFAAPVELDVEIYVRVLGIWVKAPCLRDVGSCHYADACSLIHVDKCPPELAKIGMPCKCPFPAGKWSLEAVSLFVNAKIPVSGEIKLKATLKSQDKLLTCVEMELSVK